MPSPMPPAAKCFFFFFFFFFFLILLLTFTNVACAGRGFPARVVGVTDGDTLAVLTAERWQVKIRLAGIDAPESGQDFRALVAMHLTRAIWADWASHWGDGTLNSAASNVGIDFQVRWVDGRRGASADEAGARR